MKDDSRHESRDEDQCQHDEHHKRCRSLTRIKTPTSSAQPPKPYPHRPEDHNGPPYATKQDIDGRDARVGVDEGDGQGEEDPAYDVVAYPGGEDDLADLGLEEFGLGEDPAEDGEGRDGGCG